MPEKRIRPFRPNTSNLDAMNAVRGLATNTYQDRIPETTKANIQSNIRNIMEYAPNRNEFLDALVNRIGSVVARNISWENPLSRFKQGMLAYGDTIEEVQLGLLRAKTYDPRREYLEGDIFGQEPNEAQSSFHTITRQEYYKLTVNEAMLKRAFLEDTGVASLIGQLMEQPTTSDNYDEFTQTIGLLSEFYKLGGFHAVLVPDVASNESGSEESKALLRTIRMLADKLQFISRNYNSAGMPTFAKKEDLVLIVSPEVNAALDVEALAAAFNIERTDASMLTLVIQDEDIDIPGFQAILTTKDFFVMADTLLENRNADNPVALVRNYFLHHHSILSISRFAPAILLTTNENDTIEIISTPVTGIEPIVATNPAGETVTTFERGSYYNIESDAITTPVGGVNNGVRFELTGATSDLTFLTQNGTLNVPSNEAATKLTIKAIATGTEVGEAEISTTKSYNLTGDVLTIWPNPRVDTPAPAAG